MPDYLGENQWKTKEDEKNDKPIQVLDEADIALLKTYESDTGLAPLALWNLAADKQTLQSKQPLQVARCTKIINADSEDPKYTVSVKQCAKFVVDFSDQVAPSDIEEGIRPQIDPTVIMMHVEEKSDVTYSDVGDCKEQIEKLREVVKTPLLHPERFVNLGIEPPKGMLLFNPPST
ncbi:hypothetical protein H8959_020515 [Pygathrix nigripes]